MSEKGERVVIITRDYLTFYFFQTQLNGMKRSAGARHKYRELLEMQQKAKVYQQEYEELLPHLTRTKVIMLICFI